MSLQKHLNDTRRRLLFPDRATCDDNILTPYVIESLDRLGVQRQMAPQDGLLGFTTIAILPGINRYTLDDISGKPRYLYTTTLSADANFQRQWVEIVDFDVLTQFYNAGDNVPQYPVITGFWPYLSMKAAIFNDVDNGLTLEIAPIPQRQLYLELVYEVSPNRPQTKASVAFDLTAFDAYVAAMSALAALPHCRWQGLDDAKDRKDELRAGFLYDIGSPDERRGWAYLYWQYNLSSHKRTQGRARGFLEGRLY